MTLSWFSLKSIGLHLGMKMEIDGIPLTLTQGKVLVSMVEKMVEVGHVKDDALKKSIEAFRGMYEVVGKEWRAVQTIRLKRHKGVEVQSKFFKRDQRERIMARATMDLKAEKKRREKMREVVAVVMEEAGKRNKKDDHSRISGALDSLFDTLNKTDQEQVFKTLGKKLGRTVRFKRADK